MSTTISRSRPGEAAIRHILTSPSIAPRTRPFLAGDVIDWAGLVAEAEAMSSGQALLVRIAYDLVEPDSLVALWEVARRLDARNLARVVEALWLSRGIDAAAAGELVENAA